MKSLLLLICASLLIANGASASPADLTKATKLSRAILVAGPSTPLTPFDICNGKERYALSQGVSATKALEILQKCNESFRVKTAVLNGPLAEVETTEAGVQ